MNLQNRNRLTDLENEFMVIKGEGRRRQWHPTPVLLPGKSHGWRSLVGCSPWGCWYDLAAATAAAVSLWMKETVCWDSSKRQRDIRPWMLVLDIEDGRDQGRAEMSISWRAHWMGQEIPIKPTVAAKSLQSCPTLCDPIDGSPPGSPVPGILKARVDWEWKGNWSGLPFPSPMHESEVAQ